MQLSRNLKASGVAALVLVGFLGGVARAEPLSPAAQRGRVFVQVNCAKCHAVQGRGGKVGPDLARTTRPHSFYELASAMWDHLPRMTARMQ